MNDTLSCPPLWPSTLPCSGHGQCVNGTCICDSAWSGRADYIDTRGTNCVTHVTARLGLMWIAWIFSSLALLYTCYAFWRLRPCYLRLRKQNPTAAERRGGTQILVLIMVLNALFALAVTTTCLFGGIYIRENLGTTIIFICFSAGQLGMTIYQARSWIRLAAQVASDIEFKNQLSSIIVKIDIFMAAQTFILGGLIAICALGVNISQDLNTQLIMYRVGVLTHSVALFAGYLVYAKFSQDVIVALRNHVSMARAMYKEQKADKHQVKVFKNVLDSLISSRARLTVLYILASSAELITGIIPHATSYISWFVMTFGPLSYILRVRRDILPIADTLSRTTTGFNSSTASGLSSYQRSTSGGSSDTT